MPFSLATLVPSAHELIDDEIARTEAELEAASNKLRPLIQLRQLSEDTNAAKEARDKLASQAAAQKQCHEQISASIEVLKGRLSETA
jgi:hypothetical protein